jgi:hypothetical protein
MTKADLHRLVDELPDVAVDAAAVLLLRAATDPVLAVHEAAPLDDEPLTAADEAEIAEARAAIRRGEGVPWEQVRRELHAAD